MKRIFKQALQRFAKLTPDQIHSLFLSMADDLERMESVLESLTEGILVCDSQHCLVMANKRAKLLLSFIKPGDKKRGDTPMPIWSVAREKEVAEFFKETLLSGDRVDSREFELKDNRLVSLSILPLVKNYRIAGSLINIKDITEKRRKEIRIRQIESLASLTTLAAGVAHEIKNPLGSISIHIQLLQKAFAKNEELYFLSHPEDRPDPNFTFDEKGPTYYFSMFHRYMDVINEEIERLNHIVVDFLFAVRPMQINTRESDFNAFIRELAGFTAYEMEQKNVKTELVLDESLPFLEFDPQLMKNAFLNLIQNAAAAMEDGGTLTIKTEYNETEAAISVIDTGKGIPEHIMAKIFEPYFTTKERGSGLGLTLVFKIIREHKGEVNVYSKEGEGTCFTITLPLSLRERHLLPSPVIEKHEELI